MFWEMIWTLLVAILTGGFTLAGVYITHHFQNKPSVIMEKTKAKAIQKLKISSMIGIINGRRKVTTAIYVIINEIELLIREIDLQEAETPPSYSREDYSETINKCFAIKKTTEALTEKVEKFIFLLENDMIINKKDKVIEKEIKEMRKINEKHKGMWEEFIVKTRIDGILPPDTNYEIRQLLTNFEKQETIIQINKSIEKILNVYQGKLN